ncbi:Outer membrane protein A [compost metagenome]
MFRFDKSGLQDIVEPGLSNLRHFSDRLHQDFERIERLSVQAHTDRFGSDKYNEQLSLRRAESIKEFLVQAGVPEPVIDVRAMGSLRPLVRCPGPQSKETIKCLAPNRRFEIQVDGLPRRASSTQGGGTQP